MEPIYNKEIYQLIQQYFTYIEKEHFHDDIFCDDNYCMTSLSIEKEILKGFALPQSPKYHLYLTRTANMLYKRPSNAETLYYELCIKAEEYLSKNKQSIQNLIEAARKYRQTPFDVLPEMLVHINSYTLFIYDEIMMKGKDSDKNIIAEFERIGMLNCLQEIYMLCFDKDYAKNPLYTELCGHGLQYLPAYLKWYHSRKAIA
ncbi:MAG: hypothetical protein IJT51_08105 [Bacteroidales bacterium]|nr:hypothetical protein [Bacteroidales bacterium]